MEFSFTRPFRACPAKLVLELDNQLRQGRLVGLYEGWPTLDDQLVSVGLLVDRAIEAMWYPVLAATTVPPELAGGNAVACYLLDATSEGSPFIFWLPEPTYLALCIEEMGLEGVAEAEAELAQHLLDRIGS